MTRAIVPLADGVEEMEAVIIIDTLRRAGWEVVCAGVRDGVITASRGVRLVPDTHWDAVDSSAFDALVIPGGSEGTKTLRRDKRILSAVREFMAGNKMVGAICAGPLVLESAGVLTGRKVTCYPGVPLTRGNRIEERVVIDRSLVTGQGPGMAFEFALALIGMVDMERARRTAAEMLL